MCKNINYSFDSLASDTYTSCNPIHITQAKELVTNNSAESMDSKIAQDSFEHEGKIWFL